MGGKDATRTPKVRSADPPIPVRIQPLAPHHAPDAARLHIDGQPGTFLSTLGPEILRIVYEKLPDTDVGFGFAATSPALGDEQPVLIGFVSATTSVGSLFIQTAAARAGRLLPPLTARCMRRPSLIGQALQTALYPFTSRDDTTSAGARKSGAELLSIMVEEHWRNRGVGAMLLHALLDECATRGIDHLDVTVDAGNEAARRFYADHGFQLQKSFRLYGRDMVQYGRHV